MCLLRAFVKARQQSVAVQIKGTSLIADVFLLCFNKLYSQDLDLKLAGFKINIFVQRSITALYYQYKSTVSYCII